MFVANALLFLADFVFGLIEFLLGLRFVLKLLGAGTDSQFVAWVYLTSEPLVQVFQKTFPTPNLKGMFLIEISTVIAILTYGIIAFFLQELIKFIKLQRGVLEKEKNKKLVEDGQAQLFNS